MTLFDSHRYQLHLERARSLPEDHRFLIDDIGAELIDRLQDIKRNFQSVLDLSAFKLPLERLNRQLTHLAPPYKNDLNLPKEHYDLVLSNLSIHWVEDIIGLLVQINQSLKSDSLFMGSLYGGDTLHELRTCLMEAEMDITGGAALRTAPMTRLQDAPALLSRAGFVLPVVDTERYTITYTSLRDLIDDLRGMGETLKSKETSHLSKILLQKTEALYFKNYSEDQKTIPVTVEVITLTGWSG